MKRHWVATFLFLIAGAVQASESVSPAEIHIGKMLFHETRFAYFFFKHANNINEPLTQGDPVLDSIPTANGLVPGPFRGQSLSCASCHMTNQAPHSYRAFNDHFAFSPVTERDDGPTTTLRNSPTLISNFPGSEVALSLHFDGEFSSSHDLVHDGLMGRNLGWLPNERSHAFSHIIRVIREDDGKFNASALGYSYSQFFLGVDDSLPSDLILPENLRLNVHSASSSRILHLVVELISSYMESLQFKRTSPYDVFLQKNNLPKNPESGESLREFAVRMQLIVKKLETPQFVSPNEGSFTLHQQAFEFGQSELRGLKLFFGKGQCFYCHMPPLFSDYMFHNTGISQLEFDSVHSDGAFSKLVLPSLKQRNENPEKYLPRTFNNPNGSGIFAARANVENPLNTDLGLWNAFANPTMQGAQKSLIKIMCDLAYINCNDQEPYEKLYPRTLAAFKTPTLRNLGHTEPYFHNASSRSLEDVVRTYQQLGHLAKAGKIRNVDHFLVATDIADSEITDIVAFLRSLNEDFE